MDAHALLSAQGWRGHGHSLHKTDDSIGLSKPLLLNRKDNTKGLGTANHFNNDQWWLNAFDEQLKGLETSKKGGVKQTVTTGKLNNIEVGSLGRWSVYSSFVRGGFLEGTVHLLNEDSSSSEDNDGESSKTKPKRTKEERALRRAAKEERRIRKEARRKRKDERALKRVSRRQERALAKAARRTLKEAKKAQKAQKKGLATTDSADAADEEKRRRRARKEEKRKAEKTGK